MDYKELIIGMLVISKYEKCKEYNEINVGNVFDQAATAITDLLARAEAAEDRAEKAEKCISEIEEALKFGRYSAAMLRIFEYRGQKEEQHEKH